MIQLISTAISKPAISVSAAVGPAKDLLQPGTAHNLLWPIATTRQSEYEEVFLGLAHRNYY